MKNQTVYELNLDSDAFGALKTDFNQILRRILSKMEKHESEEAKMNVEMKISLQKVDARDLSSNGNHTREVLKPTFKHKVTSAISLKDEKSGFLGGNYELVWDEDSGDYILRPIDDGQYSLFDKDTEVVEKIVPNALAEGQVDAIDVDYVDVDEDPNN